MLDQSKLRLDQTLLEQANELIEASACDGISGTELAAKLGLTRLNSRSTVRNLEKLNKITSYLCDSGRQRIRKYISIMYKNTAIEKFKEEMIQSGLSIEVSFELKKKN